MVVLRSANEIILSLIDFFKIAQPDLDVKPGTVARDLFVDAPASVLSLLYNELGSASAQQSLRLVIGSDLDKLSDNFGISRRQSTAAAGVALLTFSSINANININKGNTVSAINGYTYSVLSGISITPDASNFYKSIAAKYRDQLDLIGISDEYAVEVTVIANVPGAAGNIGKYAINRVNIPGVSNATNINSFSGGSDQESDTVFRNRILSTFNGASVGTALGYLNTALSISGVTDAYVVEPGDVLMTRDGTVVNTLGDGTKTIVSEGSGGKVDIVILGSNLVENSDSFIYRDKSNTGDPTNDKNNFILGQISGDENKTINKKRIDNIKSGILPSQPVNSVVEVTGSSSGANFVKKTTDQYGRVFGNFELIKDTSVYAGSPWGFDTFKWISNKVSMYNEDLVKGTVNGQDPVTFTDVLEIHKIEQTVPINNENSTVTTDRSIIQLLHTPVSNVTRVFNVNTGERYLITDQNLDKTGTYNTTGRIKISGNTLPSQSDVLQVDYNWIVNYDQYTDFDGLVNTKNIRPVTDSIDWGFSSKVKLENIDFTIDGYGNFFTGTASSPISSITSVLKYSQASGKVYKITSGLFVNRLAVFVDNLDSVVSSVDSIVLNNTNTELFSTAENNGLFVNGTTIFGISILNNSNIILPTDTIAQENQQVTVILNSGDVYTGTTSSGSFAGNKITIPASLVNTTANKINLKVNYIANVTELFSSSAVNLPFYKISNGYSNVNANINFSPVNLIKRQNQTVQQNTSSQFYIELSLSSNDYTIDSNQVVTVIRLSDNLELWNNYNTGSINIGTNGNYQLILSGYNTPSIGENVLVIFYANDIRRYQPFSYENKIIKTRQDYIKELNLTQYYVPLNYFTSDVGPISFIIKQPNSDITILTGTDGSLVDNSNSSVTLSSILSIFGNIPNILNCKVIISGSSNSENNGEFDIIGYDNTTNSITFKNDLNYINHNQIMIVKIGTNKEIWNYNCFIDINNNRLIIPKNSTISVNDKVYVIFFNYKNLRQTPTKLLSNITDQSVNTGTISVQGTTLYKVEDVIFTSTNNGLKLNFLEAIRKSLNLPSTSSVPSNIKLAKIAKLEKVITVSANNDEVLQTVCEYNLDNTYLQNNLLFGNDTLINLSLSNLEAILPSTTNNIASSNIPARGDKLKVTLYYYIENDIENLVYSRNGSLYTNKKFVFINKIFVSSGFSNSLSTKLTLSAFNQPGSGAIYKCYYDYVAPKQNERILIRYNYNNLIKDGTLLIEQTRPINADVIVREAKRTLLNLTINVVISDEYKSSTTTVLQNLRDQLIATLTTTTLGSIIDTPTLVNVAQSVDGISRARIIFFNRDGEIGSVIKVQGQNDEYFASNNLIINTETR